MRLSGRFFASFALAAALATVVLTGHAQAQERWSEAKAAEWERKTPWLVGSNYIPSTAINELEMWQAETFDPETIDRELGWAQSLGFTSVRVFLHDIPYHDDAEGFLGRIDKFLEIAEKHQIGVMLVLFDGVWDPDPKAGPQREPRPGVHNSGWVQSPGRAILGDPARHDELKPYVTGVVGRFKDDPRVQVWDVFNEPDNPNRNSYGDRELTDKAEKAGMLLEKAFGWCREAGATQPLTCGVWIGQWPDPDALKPIEKLQIEGSDIISFHSYDPPEVLAQAIANLKRYNRPILCTEYMARPRGSRFDPILGTFKSEGVGAYNWGFVDGKSQTIIPWDSWQKPYESEPDPWFHDIFRRDGTPYDESEVAYIRKVTGAPAPK